MSIRLTRAAWLDRNASDNSDEEIGVAEEYSSFYFGHRGAVRCEDSCDVSKGCRLWVRLSEAACQTPHGNYAIDKIQLKAWRCIFIRYTDTSDFWSHVEMVEMGLASGKVPTLPGLFTVCPERCTVRTTLCPDSVKLRWRRCWTWLYIAAD